MYLSGDNFIKICNVFILDEKYFNNLKKLGNIKVEVDNMFNHEKNVFFIKTDKIENFTSYILPYLKNNFIIVTHNSDHKSGENKVILENPLLIKWFGQNMNTKNKKTYGIPIGLENLNWKRTDFKVISENYNNPKNNLLYLNFSTNTNKDRIKIMKSLLDKGFTKNKILPWNKYINDMSTYKFAISPEGNGIDCHRTWECLYLGVIPIVKKSVALSFFSDLPILYVDNYDIITEEYLNDIYRKDFQNKKFNYRKLNTEYYKNKINKLLSECKE